MARTIVPQETTTPRFINDGYYMVDSRSDTLVAYEVRNLEHGWECNCIAAAHHRNCWHVLAVLGIETAKAIATTVGAPRAASRSGLKLEDLFEPSVSERVAK
jgi:hypothetical protein